MLGGNWQECGRENDHFYIKSLAENLTPKTIYICNFDKNKKLIRNLKMTYKKYRN